MIQGRFSELGAKVFYPHMEADEVDGLEEFVDKWIAGLWGPLKQAALGSSQVHSYPFLYAQTSLILQHLHSC